MINFLKRAGVILAIYSAGVLAILALYGPIKKDIVYKSAMAVRIEPNVRLTSPCVKTNMKAKVTADTVILSFPTDKLSGKPVVSDKSAKMADLGIIIVEEENGQRFGISKALIPNTLPTRDNELFVLVEPGMIILFEQKEGCKGIEAYLEAQSKLPK